MKRYLIPVYAMLLAVSSPSCNKADKGNVTVDSLQIQYGGGFTSEPVWNFYMISGGTVKEDTTTPFSNKSPDHFDKVLSQDKYDAAEPLLTEVPARLLRENNTNYREGNVMDGGTATIIAYREGQKYTWSFYDATDELPRYVKPYAEKVHHAISKLRE